MNRCQLQELDSAGTAWIGRESHDKVGERETSLERTAGIRAGGRMLVAMKWGGSPRAATKRGSCVAGFGIRGGREGQVRAGGTEGNMGGCRRLQGGSQHAS